MSVSILMPLVLSDLLVDLPVGCCCYGGSCIAAATAFKTTDTFIVHGGVPSDGFSIASLDAISPELRASFASVLPNADAPDAPAGTPADGRLKPDSASAAELLQGVLWSDPAAFGEIGTMSNESRGGAGCLFGTDVVRDFLMRHGLKRLVRSHRMC